LNTLNARRVAGATLIGSKCGAFKRAPLSQGVCLA